MDGSFERSLYIVHERMLLVFTDVEAPASERVCDIRRFCRNLELALLALLLFFFSILITLHSTHVGSPGCFGAVANAAARAWGNASNATAASFFLPSDVFHIELLPLDTWEGASASLWEPGGQNVSWSPALGAASLAGSAASVPMQSSLWDYVYTPVGGPALVYLETGGYTPRSSAGLRRVELHLPLRCSGGGGPGGGTLWLFASGLAAYDSVMVNELAYTFSRRGGFLASMATGEVWNWGPMATELASPSPLSSRRPAATALAALDFRLSFAATALFSFFALSSLCALLLRVLLTSGVALVYPWARCLVVACVARVAQGPERAMRTEAAVREVDRSLNAAYPWLGAHVAFARRQAALFERVGVAQGLVGADGEVEGAGGQQQQGAGGGGGEEGAGAAAAAQQQQQQQQQQQPQAEEGPLLPGGAQSQAQQQQQQSGGVEGVGAASSLGLPPLPPPLPPPPPPPPLPQHAAGAGGDAWAFLWAHVQATIVLFLAAQLSATLLASSTLLGWKSAPKDLPTDVWFVFFLGEVLTLFSLRSQASITLFPRAFLALYLAAAIYYVKCPYGFFEEALTVWVLAVLAVHIRLVRAVEVPALREGKISYHRPRELLARLPAPQPFAPASGIIPALYTVFLPLNFWLPHVVEEGQEGGGAYAIPVPPRDQELGEREGV